MMDKDSVFMDLHGCARCDGEGHPMLTFEKLKFPILEEGKVVATHWAPCPTNGEPILLVRAPDIEPYLQAVDRMRKWVEQYGGDWHDPVWSEQVTDDIRRVLNMEPEDRSE